MSLATREAFNGFRRSPVLSVLSIMTIAFSLYAFGLFGLVALNIRAALAQVEDRVEIRAFVADGTTAEATSTAAGDIGAFPEVQSVTFVTSEEALERARKDLGEFSDVFEAGILPASLDVQLKPGFRDPATVKAVADRLKTYDFADDVRYGEEWVQKLYRIRNIATLAGIVLGLAFAGVAVIIIGSTIRMAVLARAREIAIMRLVGATDGFIRSPFLIDGAVKGTLGGVLALALTWVSFSLITRFVITAQFFDVRLVIAGVAAGAVLGFIGSALSVSRHLRNV
ncbi:MAG: permease-like cell division protein FtsX [Gemmatimonadetes bacterium]|jgi:cell division transport system permease protein|nr:permease-like cell division protein FtsX [Gemmatimonadota bacterium]